MTTHLPKNPLPALAASSPVHCACPELDRLPSPITHHPPIHSLVHLLIHPSLPGPGLCQALELQKRPRPLLNTVLKGTTEGAVGEGTAPRNRCPSSWPQRTSRAWPLKGGSVPREQEVWLARPIRRRCLAGRSGNRAWDEVSAEAIPLHSRVRRVQGAQVSATGSGGGGHLTAPGALPESQWKCFVS